MTNAEQMAPETLDDVAGRYAALREQAPVVRVTFPGFPMPVWVITGYEDVKRALRDPRFVVDQGNVPGLDGPSMVDRMIAMSGVTPEYRDFLTSMVFMDGDAHTRLRTLVAPAFSVRRITALRKRIEQHVRDLFAPLVGAENVDLIADFSLPLAGTVVCELIGVDDEDRPKILGWINDQASPEAGTRRDSIVGMVAYTKGLIERRRARPAEDLVSDLIAAKAGDGGSLTETEMIAMVLMLINAGLHTSSHFVANSTLKLLDHPEQLELLRAKPDMLPQAVHELLRVANILPLSTPMYASEDLTFAGAEMKQGDVVTGSLAGANFDPAQFPEPLKFDITRTPDRAETHVAFGHGPHYCLGAALARLEGEIALAQLLIEHRDIALAVDRSELQYRPQPGGSLLVALPVKL